MKRKIKVETIDKYMRRNIKETNEAKKNEEEKNIYNKRNECGDRPDSKNEEENMIKKIEVETDEAQKRNYNDKK